MDKIIEVNNLRLQILNEDDAITTSSLFEK